MRVLLIDVDSRLPNLALMKISTYHKLKEDVVGFNVTNPDMVYISIVFTENKNNATLVPFEYPEAHIIRGGPGYDPTVKLSPDIECMPPDHDLYKSHTCSNCGRIFKYCGCWKKYPSGIKYSVGRITSGCIRKCNFCVVHLLEPEGIRYLQHPKDIWKENTILRLLDDNIFALPKAFWDMHQFCLDNNVKLHLEYLDIRLLTPKFAKGLHELKHDVGIWFSFDLTAMKPIVIRGVKRLKDAGFGGRSIHFFVYLHDEQMIPDAMYRWGVLRDLEVEPFLMVNKDNLTPRLKRIRKRGCRPAIWRGLTAEEVFK